MKTATSKPVLFLMSASTLSSPSLPILTAVLAVVLASPMLATSPARVAETALVSLRVAPCARRGAAACCGTAPGELCASRRHPLRRGRPRASCAAPSCEARSSSGLMSHSQR
eukprot:5416768-Pleurochrysis_carterae.AAC.1